MTGLADQLAASVRSVVAAWLLGWGWWGDQVESARRYRVLTNPLLDEWEAHHQLSEWRSQR